MGQPGSVFSFVICWVSYFLCVFLSRAGLKLSFLKASPDCRVCTKGPQRCRQVVSCWNQQCLSHLILPRSQGHRIVESQDHGDRLTLRNSDTTRITGRTGYSLYISRAGSKSVVQLPTMVSSSYEWKSKDLAVAQSRKASRGRSESEFSFFQCPYIGLQQKVWPRLKVHATD